MHATCNIISGIRTSLLDSRPCPIKVICRDLEEFGLLKILLKGLHVLARFRYLRSGYSKANGPIQIAKQTMFLLVMKMNND